MAAATNLPDRLAPATDPDLAPGRIRAGRLVWLASALLVATFVAQALHDAGTGVPASPPGAGPLRLSTLGRRARRLPGDGSRQAR